MKPGHHSDATPPPTRPLSDEMVDAIERIRPPAAPVDFWDRLEARLNDDSAPTAEPHSSRTTLVEISPDKRPGRYRAALLAVAAAVLLFVVAGRLLSPEPTEIKPADPADASTTTVPTLRPSVATSEPASPDGPNREPAAATDSDQTLTSNPEGGDENVGDDPEPSTTTPGSSSAPDTAPAFTPLMIEGEQVDVATAGEATDDGWNLWSQGYVEHRVALPPGVYEITVQARGFSRTESAPQLELRLDGEPVGTAMVAVGSQFRPYRFVIDVETEKTRVAVAFTNDPNNPSDDVDLIIDRIDISTAD